MASTRKEKVAYNVNIFTVKMCILPNKIHGTMLKQPIRIEYLIKQEPHGVLAEKQVLTEGR